MGVESRVMSVVEFLCVGRRRLGAHMHDWSHVGLFNRKAPVKLH